MDVFPVSNIVRVLIVFMVLSLTAPLLPSIYSGEASMPAGYLSLSINYSSGGVNVALDAMDVLDSYMNTSLAGKAYFSIKNASIVSICSIRSKPLVPSPSGQPLIMINMTFSSRSVHHIIFYYFRVRTIFVNGTEKKTGYAESHLIFYGFIHPIIDYNVTGTYGIASQLLIGMIRRMLFNPLLATNITEHKVMEGSNITVRGRASVINALILVNGGMSFAASGRVMKGMVNYVITRLSLTYNITASYPVPIYRLLREILVKGLNGYKGEPSGALFLTPYLGGITTASLRGGSNIINDILALSMITNITELGLKLSAANHTCVLNMNASGKTRVSPPDLVLALIASTRGYKATGITGLISIMERVKTRGEADPEALVSRIDNILGKPIYSYKPQVYENNNSKATIILPSPINSTVTELLGKIASMLGLKTFFKITGNEIIVKPYPSIREAIAIYMALNNIQPILETATTTTTTTTTTSPPLATTTTTAPPTHTTRTTTTSIAPTTTSRPQTTSTRPATTTHSLTTSPTIREQPVKPILTTATTANKAAPSPSPILALIPLAILGLIILYLHYRAKKRITENLLGQPGEAAEESEGEPTR